MPFFDYRSHKIQILISQKDNLFSWVVLIDDQVIPAPYGVLTTFSNRDDALEFGLSFGEAAVDATIHRLKSI